MFKFLKVYFRMNIFQIEFESDKYIGTFFTIHKLSKTNAYIIIVYLGRNYEAYNKKCLDCGSKIALCSDVSCQCPCLKEPNYDVCQLSSKLAFSRSI